MERLLLHLAEAETNERLVVDESGVKRDPGKPLYLLASPQAWLVETSSGLETPLDRSGGTATFEAQLAGMDFSTVRGRT